MHLGRETLAAAVAAALAHAVPEAAGQQVQRVENIEVTGSNIRRVEQEGPAPVEAITREQLERSGASTLSEALRNLPSNSAGSWRSSTRSSSTATAAASSTPA